MTYMIGTAEMFRMTALRTEHLHDAHAVAVEELYDRPCRYVGQLVKHGGGFGRACKGCEFRRTGDIERRACVSYNGRRTRKPLRQRRKVQSMRGRIRQGLYSSLSLAAVRDNEITL